MKPAVSVVVPIYKSESTVVELCERLTKHLESAKLTFEIVLVNDGSPDNSWSLIESLVTQNKNVVAVNLSRNFGQHNAILAGLEQSVGEWVVVMDADLQDTPEVIATLWEKATTEGVDNVIVRRKNRNDGFLTSITSKMFYKILSILNGMQIERDSGNFGIYSRRQVEAIVSVGDQDFFLPTVVKWSGYKGSNLEIERPSRQTGQSSYTLPKRLRLAIRVLVINSNKLLGLSITAGLLATVFGFVYAIYLVVQAITNKIQVAGWASIMVVIFFMGGAILVSNGVLGLYLGRVFENTKNRPRYVVAGVVKH